MRVYGAVKASEDAPLLQKQKQTKFATASKIALVTVGLAGGVIAIASSSSSFRSFGLGLSSSSLAEKCADLNSIPQCPSAKLGATEAEKILDSVQCKTSKASVKMYATGPCAAWPEDDAYENTSKVGRKEMTPKKTSSTSGSDSGDVNDKTVVLDTKKYIENFQDNIDEAVKNAQDTTGNITDGIKKEWDEITGEEGEEDSTTSSEESEGDEEDSMPSPEESEGDEEDSTPSPEESEGTMEGDEEDSTPSSEESEGTMEGDEEDSTPSPEESEGSPESVKQAEEESASAEKEAQEEVAKAAEHVERKLKKMAEKIDDAQTKIDESMTDIEKAQDEIDDALDLDDVEEESSGSSDEEKPKPGDEQPPPEEESTKTSNKDESSGSSDQEQSPSEEDDTSSYGTKA